jgi:hypothetical protein
LNTELLETIVASSDIEKLIPVVRASYQLNPLESFDLMQVANDVNKSLGQELFTDMAYSMLLQNFSIVTRMVQQHAMRQA